MSRVPWDPWPGFCNDVTTAQEDIPDGDVSSESRYPEFTYGFCQLIIYFKICFDFPILRIVWVAFKGVDFFGYDVCLSIVMIKEFHAFLNCLYYGPFWTFN
jgi:hypothetical protein